MVQALAPRRPSGYRRGLLAIVIGASIPFAVMAQTPKDAPKAPAPKDAPADAPGDNAPPAPGGDAQAPDAPVGGLVDSSQTKKVKPLEIFKDDRAEKYLPNTFPELKRPANFKLEGNPNEPQTIKAMAGGQAPFDQAALQRYIDFCTAELTSRANIKAFLEVPTTAPKDAPTAKKSAEAARSIGRAADLLLEPLITAKEAKNATFLATYNRLLLASLPKLLDNHLIARNQAMIVLGLTANQDALDVFVKQLSDKQQVVWVKEWAARGISLSAGNGKIEMRDSQKALNAGKALSDFLEIENGAPYVVKARALEALGSIRLSTQPNPAKAEMSTAALKQLADGENNPLVRAWAAWALGMIRVSPQLTKYNYGLINYFVGLAAADIGEQIVKTHEESDDEATQLTGLLLYQILPAFEGDPDVRESGLMKMPGATADKKAISETMVRVQGVCSAAVRLAQSTPGQAKARRDEMASKVSELRSILDKYKPKDFALIPGGPKFVVEDRVAGAGGNEK